MERPEDIYRQVQEQIRKIPLPKTSPHYAHYRRHYLEQYQHFLKSLTALSTDWEINGRPRLNWPALLRGFGLGAWLLVVALAFCEWHHYMVSDWIQALGDCWATWRRGRCSPVDAEDNVDDVASRSGTGPCRLRVRRHS